MNRLKLLSERIDIVSDYLESLKSDKDLVEKELIEEQNKTVLVNFSDYQLHFFKNHGYIAIYDGDTYIHLPQWFKIVGDENMAEVINKKDLPFDCHTLLSSEPPYVNNDTLGTDTTCNYEYITRATV